MNSKTVVITGSTRGIGRGLAEQLLKRGCRVVVSGRNAERLSAAKTDLDKAFGHELVEVVPCDVTDNSQLHALWDAAVERFDTVDIWINNAGITHKPGKVWNLDKCSIDDIIDTNIKGLLYGCRVAVNGMLDQGQGAIYNLEGLGSDGRMVAGVSVYGMTKRAVHYITQALHKELSGSPVIVGAIYPGMVVTDLLTADMDTMEPEMRQQTEKIINILGDRVETVTPFLVKKILANRKSGTRIKWLTGGKAMARFMFAGMGKRNLLQS